MEDIKPLTQIDNTWKVLAHGSIFLGLIVPVPFGVVLGPLLIYLIKKESDPEIADYAKEALNFSITASIAVVIFLALSVILIGLPFLVATYVFSAYQVIRALVAASNGVFYTYPYSLRLIK